MSYALVQAYCVLRMYTCMPVVHVCLLCTSYVHLYYLPLCLVCCTAALCLLSASNQAVCLAQPRLQSCVVSGSIIVCGVQGYTRVCVLCLGVLVCGVQGYNHALPGCSPSVDQIQQGYLALYAAVRRHEPGTAREGQACVKKDVASFGVGEVAYWHIRVGSPGVGCTAHCAFIPLLSLCVHPTARIMHTVP